MSSSTPAAASAAPSTAALGATWRSRRMLLHLHQVLMAEASLPHARRHRRDPQPGAALFDSPKVRVNVAERGDPQVLGRTENPIAAGLLGPYVKIMLAEDGLRQLPASPRTAG